MVVWLCSWKIWLDFVRTFCKEYLYSEKHKCTIELILYFNFLLHKYFLQTVKVQNQGHNQTTTCNFLVFLKKIRNDKIKSFSKSKWIGFYNNEQLNFTNSYKQKLFLNKILQSFIWKADFEIHKNYSKTILFVFAWHISMWSRVIKGAIKFTQNWTIQCISYYYILLAFCWKSG